MRPWRIVLAVAVVLAVAGGAGWRARTIRDALFVRVEHRLASTAALTKRAVELWIAERQGDARTVAAATRTALADRRTAPATALAAAELRQTLTALQSGLGYETVAVLDPAGRLRTAVGDTAPLSPSESDALRRVLRTGDAEIVGPVRGHSPSGLVVAVLRAIDLPGAGTVGVALLRVDPARTLLPLTSSAGEGRGTEQGRLLSRSGDRFLVAMPGPGGAFEVREGDVGALDALKLRALDSADVEGRYHNVEGRDVLAGLRHVRGARWAVVRQVDVADEMERVYRAQLRTEALLFGALLAAAALGALALARAGRARRLAERERERSLLRATLDSTADGILVVGRDGRVEAYNRQFLELWGVDEAVAATGDDALLAAARARLVEPDAFLAKVRELYATPDAESADVLAFRDGRFVERVSTPQRAGDAIIGRVWSFRDITDRERALAALRDSEASARAFVERSPFGICRVDPQGRFTAVNPALAQMLGYERPAALLGVDVTMLYVAPREREVLVRRHLAGEPLVEGYEVRWRRRDGSEIALRVSSRLVLGPDGRVAYYEAFLENVAALRAAERALRQAEKLAAVGQFVSGVAHELNNPLAAVLLFTENLLEDGALPQERETLGLIRDQALRARTIVRDLLAFVRGADGERVELPARPVLERALDVLRRQLGSALPAATLTFDAPAALGWVSVDRAAVEQVVTNLVVNAVQAAPGGQVRVCADHVFCPDLGGECLRVRVEDDGPGFPSEALSRVFEPFFTTKPVGVGTGLGLSVSLGIAERHGGTLLAENRAAEAGGGACVTLVLPLLAGPPASAADAIADAPALAGTSRRPRVLIVDDERPIRRALAQFFGRRGWEVVEASDGREALERLLGLADAEFELIVSDLRMPDLGGPALHDRLAVERPELLERLVIATGDVVSREAAEFLARTRCAVLEKPFQHGNLEALAARASRLRSAA